MALPRCNDGTEIQGTVQTYTLACDIKLAKREGDLEWPSTLGNRRAKKSVIWVAGTSSSRLGALAPESSIRGRRDGDEPISYRSSRVLSREIDQIRTITGLAN
ncbi:hypothetical protein MRX96_042160 [Rhipicephalus microplus]